MVHGKFCKAGCNRLLLMVRKVKITGTFLAAYRLILI